jgi:hypothetical protein
MKSESIWLFKSKTLYWSIWKVIGRLNAHKNKLKQKIHENRTQIDFIKYGEILHFATSVIWKKRSSKKKSINI